MGRVIREFKKPPTSDISTVSPLKTANHSLVMTALIALIASLFVGFTQTTANAATVTVSTAEQLVDAVDAANDGDIIQLEQGTYPLGEELLIGVDLTFVGLGSSNEDTVIEQEEPGTSIFVLDGGDLEIDNLTLTGVDGDGDDASAILAPIGFDLLRITDSVIRDNTSGYGAGLLIEVDDFDGFDLEIDISGTTFSGNDASFAGGAIWASSFRSLMIDSSLFASNTGGEFGGAIYFECFICDDEGESIDILNTTFRNNDADYGGALYAFGWHVLVIEGSTFNGNEAVEAGGAIFFEGWDGDSQFPDVPPSEDLGAIVNTTLSGNTADEGGAIYADFGIDGVGMLNVTVANNSSGIYVEDGGIFQVQNTILAGNGSANCDGDGLVLSTGDNIDSGDSCGFAEDGDQTETDPGLSPLADNGGPTQTHAIGESSPAVGAATEFCPDSDQRGVDRGEPCDVGAYEFVASTGTPPGVSPPGVTPPGVTPPGTVADDAPTEAGPAVPVVARPDFTG